MIIFASRIIASLSMTKTEFNNLVITIGRKLYGNAYRILRDKEGSEDAVQEVFVKLWKMNAKIDEYESVEALAVTMVRNYCIDQIRRQKFQEPAGNNSFSLYQDPQPSPLEKLESSEMTAIMHSIINGLPQIYREIIQLRDIEELSYEEIADKTGQNINTLRVNLSRARKNVRDEFNKRNNESRGNKTIA
ncbi:MAG TPA: RNA polymerase subunit sigma-70 [Bacteroidales bacterium]|nr:RNA polymerase subunit sigma-70 [Bacteroidales bacterium]